MVQAFDYDQAFSRNVGRVTDEEQRRLRTARVAIAGLGGVGGLHLLTLARLSIGRFAIADLDVIEVANFNRQTGASRSTVGRTKVEVLAEMARDINPECDLALYPDGVNESNLEAFFDGVDLYVDGLDFFAFEARERVFAHCTERGILGITVVPLGMSVALLNFLPGGMSFEDYFQVTGRPDLDKAVRYLVSLAPAFLYRNYLVDRTRVDHKARKGPTTPMACMLCAGIVGSEALKILLKQGKFQAVPYGAQFDGYRDRLARTWRPGGNRNSLNRLAIAVARHQLGID
jgi:molybdopterin/thiamine biosynthesis adenylyltransferase